MSRTAVRLAASVAAAGLALTLSACSPVLSNVPYAASDGARVVWQERNSPVRGENIVLVASEEGAVARLVGGLTNTTADDVTVTLGFSDGPSRTISVGAGSTVLMGGEEQEEVLLDGVPGSPGSNVEMVFSTPDLGQISHLVPVLDGTFPQYADLVP
ncbi:hypothetical protein [Litorihabitans aurantiacus]|uniref:DNA modification methylase n=1 Tax=Litorihabitans aurantiacus TaxID=1930061 RepID=A0AA37XFN3_9MICO|nr:hypothetical protein [Litorihabitans aurantiacus]GMA32432.1 hypothetical protein GCM10025875_24240 [Litorihabitans aurantiacus]